MIFKAKKPCGNVGGRRPSKSLWEIFDFPSGTAFPSGQKASGNGGNVYPHFHGFHPYLIILDSHVFHEYQIYLTDFTSGKRVFWGGNLTDFTLSNLTI